MIAKSAPIGAALSIGVMCATLLCGAKSACGAVRGVPSPFATIQLAVNAAIPGDTVLLAPGVHTGRPVITGKAITVASLFLLTGNRDYIDQTIIDGTNGTWALRVIPPVAPPTIVGLTLRNADDGIRATAPFNLLNCRVTGTTDGVDYEDGGGGVIRDCVFEGNSDDGIDSDHAVDALIVDNMIWNNGDDGIEIRLQPYTGPLLTIMIRNNTIMGNGEDGIQLISYNVLTSRMIRIERNLILNNAMAGVGMMCCENTVENYQGATLKERVFLYNNTIVGNDHGVTGGDSVYVVNNLIARSTRVGIKRVNSGSSVSHNLLFGNTPDHTTSNVELATTLFQDPLLRPDYGLWESSPAIDAGSPWYFVRDGEMKHLGLDEYSGLGPDLGALEFTGVLAVDPGAPPAHAALLAPAPNPSRGSTLFRLELPAASPLRLEILDLAGRRIRSLVDGVTLPGRHEFPWDGRNDAGAPAPPGVYVVRLETASQVRSLRFVRL